MKMLTLNQVRHVCTGDSSPGSGCRYLERDDLDSSRFYCLKMVEAKREAIDAEVEEYLSRLKNPSKTKHAEGVMLGDNCQGYIKLKSVWQGYDV